MTERAPSLRAVDAPTDLPATQLIGALYVTLSPLTFYAYTSTGWLVLGSATATAAAAPASEGGQGVVELASAAEVQAGTAGILVASAARLKAELDRRGAVAATETALGPVELATAAEASAGTDITRAVHPAGLKAAITPPAWIAPTLLNSWVNFGAPNEDAGYRKTPWGAVELKGVAKNGTMTNGTVIFNLPSGYRPAKDRPFLALQGGQSACRVNVRATGDVDVAGVTDNNTLSFEGVRFDVL